MSDALSAVREAHGQPSKALALLREAAPLARSDEDREALASAALEVASLDIASTYVRSEAPELAARIRGREERPMLGQTSFGAPREAGKAKPPPIVASSRSAAGTEWVKRMAIATVALTVIVVVNRSWFAEKFGGGEPSPSFRFGPANVDVSARFNDVNEGMNTLQVRGILGEPDRSQQVQSGGNALDCWYYDPNFQFCFENSLSGVQSALLGVVTTDL